MGGRLFVMLFILIERQAARDEALHGLRAVALALDGEEDLALGVGVVELVVEERLVGRGQAHERVRQERRAEPLARHVVGRHELVEVEAHMRRDLVVLEQLARAAVHVVALAEQQEVGIREGGERHGWHGGFEVAAHEDVLARQSVLGEALVDGKGRRHGQQDVVLIKRDRLVERIVADAAVDDDVELLGRELVEEVGGVRLGDGERDVRVAAAERLDHRRQEARGEEVRAAEPQRAALEPREVVAVALEVALDAEDALGSLDVGAAGVGQL